MDILYQNSRLIEEPFTQSFSIFLVSDKTGNVHICKSVDAYWTLKSRVLASPLATPRSRTHSFPLNITVVFHHQFVFSLIINSFPINTLIQRRIRLKQFFQRRGIRKRFNEYTGTFVLQEPLSPKVRRFRNLDISELSMFKKIGLQLELFIIVDEPLDYNGFTREREREREKEETS